jgi:hypothetical protein
MLDRFLVPSAFDYSVDVDAGEMNLFRVQRAFRNNFFNFNNADLACSRNIRVEISSCLPENQISSFVSFVSFDEREVAR